MAGKKPRLKQVPLFFGELPVNALNQALGLELEPGDAVMSPNAQKHASRRHPEDFARCLPHVAAVIGNPLYARDDFKNEGAIELVGRPVGLSHYLLIAVEISLDADGRYNVSSIYPISDKKVENRREGGFLKRLVLI